MRTFSCSWVTVPTFTLLGSPLPALICASQRKQAVSQQQHLMGFHAHLLGSVNSAI